MTIVYNTTTRHIVLLAKAKADRSILEKMIAFMTNQGRFFKKEITTDSIVVRIPVLSEELVSDVVDFAV